MLFNKNLTANSLILLLTLTLFFAFGCGEESPSGTDSGTCEADADCVSGKFCQQGSCKDKPVGYCSKPSDCPAGQLCENSICKSQTGKQCNTDADCTGEEKPGCNLMSRRCELECSNDTHCPNGTCDRYAHKCVGKQKECTKDGDCSTKTNKGCNLLTNSCEWQCTIDAHCPSGLCDIYSHKCTTGMECNNDADCAGALKKGCNTVTKKCEWGCASDAHCPNSSCDLTKHTCKPIVKDCQSDLDCASEINKGCNTVTKRCEWSCTQDSQCTNGICDLNTHICISVGSGCAGCKSDEFCFGNQKCIKKFMECQKDLDCGKDQKCISIGAKNSCLDICDPAKNVSTTDNHNNDCWVGYGECTPLSNDQTTGVCQLPRENNRNLNETCSQNDPEKEDFHDCQSTDLICVGISQYSSLAYCWKSCDPTKNDSSDLNPACSNNKGKCIKLQDGGGVCEPEREKKRLEGETCLQGFDNVKPEYHDCQSTLTCLEGKKICAKPRTNTQTLGAKCETENVGQPDYNSCAAGNNCYKNKCFKSCNPASPACGNEETCMKTSVATPNDGICHPIQLLECEREKDANDQDDPSKHNCPTDFFCFKFNIYYRCVKPCDPSATTSTCDPNYTCRKFDLNDATKGYCIPDRQKLNKKGDVCYYSDPTKTNYHGCQAGLDCDIENFTCTDAFPKTQTAGQECETNNKGCQAGLTCLYNKGGEQKVCATSCSPFQTGQCQAGELCISTQEKKYYWDGGCFQERKEELAEGAECYCQDTTQSCYNECTSPLKCYTYISDYKVCAKECAKDEDCPDTSQYCETYFETCLKKSTNTQQAGYQCFQSDPRKDSYNDCDETKATCLNLGDMFLPDYWCLGKCDLKTPNCDQDYDCRQVDSETQCTKDEDCTESGFYCMNGICAMGVCLKLRKETRDMFEECGAGDPKIPSYHGCKGTDLLCVGGGAKNYCLTKCDTNAPQCSQGFSCMPLSDGTDGICAMDCTQLSECTAHGTECTTIGDKKVCL